MRQLVITQSITSRESASLEKYLHEISKIKLLSVDEEVKLCLLIKQGDKHALQCLVNANLRFVVSVAKRYQNQGLSLADLINEGNIGLINCIDRFDTSRGFKFISYAVWWIRQSIIMALAENGRIVRIPLSRVSLNGRIRQARSALEQSLEREASAEELAGVLDVKEKDISFNLAENTRHVSLDAPFAEGEDGSLLDNLESNDSRTVNNDLFHKQSLRIELSHSLGFLTARQKEILCSFFGINLQAPLGLDEIGKKFNLSGERIRQIKDHALQKLRNMQNNATLRSYL